MRLFAALDPPADAVAHLESALPGERDAAWRWTPGDQWHVTLAFFGEVPDATVGPLADRLVRAAARTGPLVLQLAGVGTFPRQARRANVLWCGLAGDVERLQRLAERAIAAGRRSGLPMERRAFRGHLTVARARRGSADATALLADLASYAGPTWTAGELRLVRSHLGPSVRHETLAAWPLSDA